MPIIELENLTKRYGSVVALNSANLSIQRGEFVSLLGPSGSGKTTLLNLIAGMDQPTSGNILLEGLDAARLPPGKRGLGMVFQSYALMPHMTVSQNIAFPLEVRKVSKAEIGRRVGEVLELIRLPHIANRKPRELSGGQQQRVSLARCLVYKPSIILMDEPLGALDRKLRKEMQVEISNLHRQIDLTIVYVTHDQEEALTMSDRIVLMNQGCIEQTGTADDLYFRPRNSYVAEFIGDSNILEGRIISAGRDVQVQLDKSVVHLPQPDFEVVPGQSVLVLVRPENAILLEEGEQRPQNLLAGELRETMVAGSLVKHLIARPDGSLFEVQQINHVNRHRRPLGSSVEFGWRTPDGRVLPLDGVSHRGTITKVSTEQCP